MQLKAPISPELNDLRNAFVRAGFDMRMVGGVVRDLVRGIEPKDIDLCTDANPDEQIAVYKANGFRYFETGLAHGTISVRAGDEIYEITSLRTETDHDGRHAVVSYTKDWLGDLGRRDLTFNAMALTFDGVLIDPFNGVADLEAGITRFVGSPDERMREDYLRILRWLRFHGRIANGKPLDSETSEAVKRNANGLRGISRERVWMEVSKIVAGDNACDLIQAMHDLGIAEHIDLPSGSLNCLQVASYAGRNPVALMVAMIGDVSRVSNLAHNWKWSAAERDLAIFLANNMYAKNYMFLMAHDGHSQEWVAELVKMQGNNPHFVESAIVPVFPVKGQDLIDAGMKPGAEMGKKLKVMKADWAASDFALSKKHLMEM
jgi:tRNA nucleotidyltransferase (CCA-adding enzyme)